MSRPRHIWLSFGVCLTVLLAAMGWVSWTALRLDDSQRRAAQQAEFEEKVRLALWRMDSAVAPLILEESARPYQTYEPFPPVTRAYKKGGSSFAEGDVLTPSPLLAVAPGHVQLHFQFIGGGALTSPQVPTGAQRNLAEQNYTTRANIEAAARRLDQLHQLLDQPPPAPANPSRSSTTWLRSSRSSPSVLEPGRPRELLVQMATANINTPLPAPSAPVPTRSASANSATPKNAKQASAPVPQQLRSQAELNARANVYQQAQQRAALANDNFLNQAPPLAPRAKEGLFAPVWLGQELFLVRRVDLDHQFIIQGCWLSWVTLKQWLLANVTDLLPEGDLQRAPSTGSGRGPASNAGLAERTLAALPVKLSPGPSQLGPLDPWSPVRFSLVVAWVCILLAGGAVALLLHGTLSLSERRAAFVSAVTHELRTPLTTFKIYSEMLAAEMVPDEQKRQDYLNTL